MSQTVIKVENLSKQYVIGRQKESYKTLRDAIAHGTKSVVKQMTNSGQEKAISSEFWALQDINFEINQGDRLGIIGRNGAGKSTLLKILSRITEPTEGKIRLNGRVASLLEVGTGFHPELTGRENIFLNGAILGMTKVEIRQKFDQIVDFAEVEKFLDTPVKRYSSGMYVRLAFAVAAHLEPEILIVDEVLAVGDAKFQQKCLGRMEQVGKEGRTVIFVSHNLGAIKSLCSASLVLDSGSLVYQGSVNQGISHYNNSQANNITNFYQSTVQKDTPQIKKIEITQPGNQGSILQMHRPIQIDCEFDRKRVKDLVVTIVVRNSEGNWLIHSTDEFATDKFGTGNLPAIAQSNQVSNINSRKCKIPANTLAEGDYYLMFALGVRDQKVYEKLDDVIKIQVEFSGKMADKTTGNHWKGCLAPGILQWGELP